MGLLETDYCLPQPVFSLKSIPFFCVETQTITKDTNQRFAFQSFLLVIVTNSI